MLLLTLVRIGDGPIAMMYIFVLIMSGAWCSHCGIAAHQWEALLTAAAVASCGVLHCMLMNHAAWRVYAASTHTAAYNQISSRLVACFSGVCVAESIAHAVANFLASVQNRCVYLQRVAAHGNTT